MVSIASLMGVDDPAKAVARGRFANKFVQYFPDCEGEDFLLAEVDVDDEDELSSAQAFVDCVRDDVNHPGGARLLGYRAAMRLKNSDHRLELEGVSGIPHMRQVPVEQLLCYDGQMEEAQDSDSAEGAEALVDAPKTKTEGFERSSSRGKPSRKIGQFRSLTSPEGEGKVVAKRFHQVASYGVLMLLLAAVLSVFMLQFSMLHQPAAVRIAFCAVYAVSAAAALAACAFDLLPKRLYGGRALTGLGLVLLSLGMLQLGSSVVSGEPNVFGQVVAALMLGSAQGIGLVKALELCRPTEGALYGVGMFASFFVAFALMFVAQAGPWACWGVAVGAGCGAFAFLLANPALKNLDRLRGGAAAAPYRRVGLRMGGGMFLLAMAWGYSIYHFLNHSPVFGLRGLLLTALAGEAAMLVVYGAIVAVNVLWRKRRSGEQSGAPMDVPRGQRTSFRPGLALLKALPFVMIVSFVPLDYLVNIAPLFQIWMLMAFGATIVPLCLEVSREVAVLCAVKPLAVDAWVVIGLMAGALAGVLANVAFGASDGSLVWALAPVLTVGLGFLSCNYLMTKSSLLRESREIAAASSAQGSVETAIDLSAVAANCESLARASGLTAREVDVLRLLVRGYSVPHICEMLHIAEGTAITHRRHIYQKLEVHNKNELIDCVLHYKEE